MIISQHIPAVHATRKSRMSEQTKELAVCQVMEGAWGMERPLPVVLDGRIIAWVGWSAKENAVYAIRHQPWFYQHIDEFGILFSFPTTDALITDITGGKSRQFWWLKYSYTSAPPTLSWVHWYSVEGYPSGGLWNGTAYTARQHTDGEAGAIPHGGNVSTDTKHIISATIKAPTSLATDVSVFCLYDMVISYDQCALSSSNTNFTNTLTAQRYVGTGKPGLQVMGCLNTNPGGTTGFAAFTYTSATGSTGRTFPNLGNFIYTGSTGAGPGFPGQSCWGYANGRGILAMPLITGDSGVQKLDAITMNATTTDQFNAILGFPLCYLCRTVGNEHTYTHDFVKQATSVPRVYDGACLTWASLVVGSPNVYHGDITFAWGS